jgi:hypothetical protein
MAFVFLLLTLSDFGTKQLKCKPADDSKALILSCKKLAIFSFYFLPSYGSIDDIFLNFTLMSLSLFFFVSVSCFERKVEKNND